jgi:membrane-associated phospholipid phosphatase
MQPGPFVNQFAAVPSFHFGWMLLVAIAIWRNTSSSWPKALAVMVTVATFWATAVTGNHFFFDMIVGGLIVILALYVANLVQSGRLAPGRVVRLARERFSS